MGLEAGTYIGDLVSTNPVGGTDTKSQGDDHLRLIKSVLQATFPNASRAFRFESVVSKAGAYNIVAADARALFLADATGGAFALTLPLGANVYAGYTVLVVKSDASANAVTVDGNGAETINGAATRALSVRYQCEKYTWDGAEWKVIALTRVGSGELLDSAVATAKIADEAVTYAKMQHVTDARLLGRAAGSPGDVQEISAAATLSLASGVLSIAAGGVNTTQLADEGVTLTKLAHIATDRLLGRDTAGTGDPEAIALGTGLAFNGSGSIISKLFTSNLLHLQDQKTAGSNGGSSSASAWTKRTLDDTVGSNTISGSSVASSVVTLPTGTYFIWAQAPMIDSGNHKLRWRNTTTAATALAGRSTRSGDSNTAMEGTVFGLFSVAAATEDFELQYYCTAAKPTVGLGQATGAGQGEVEVYAEAIIIKVA